MTDHNFLRGSRPLTPTNHIVLVELMGGGQVLRRCSLNIVQMRAIEDSLMRLQHDGFIRGYILTAAEDCNVSELLTWIASFADRSEQPELANLQQNSLFAGGGQ